MSLFNKLFGASQDVVASLKKPFLKSKLQRNIQSAKDNALESIVNSIAVIKEEIAKVEKMDIQVITNEYQDMEDQKRLVETLSKLYKAMFDEDLSVDKDLMSDPFDFSE